MKSILPNHHAELRNPRIRRIASGHFRSTHLPRAAALALLVAAPMPTHAQDGTTRLGATANDFDRMWSLATLYQDNANPLVEEFKLRGRYQGQFWNVDDDHGNPSNWEDRRSRLGFDAKLFEKQLEVRLDFQANDGFVDFYDGLVDAYLRWKPRSWLTITAGKTKPLIAQYDWLESTTTQPTFERSQIFNQLGINRATALTVEGTTAAWSWRAGVYSNGTPATTGGTGAWGDGEFGDFDGGMSFSLGAGYDFKSLLAVDKADLRLDWLHSDRQPGDLVLGKYDDIISTTFWVKQGEAGVVIEGFFASGGDATNSDVFGFYIEPTYDLIPKKLQLVGRYSLANSEGPLGVIGQSRYERSVATNQGKGNAYQALYGGAQYFIYGDKLKLMAGAEWSRIARDPSDSYNGFTLLTGVRLSF